MHDSSTAGVVLIQANSLQKEKYFNRFVVHYKLLPEEKLPVDTSAALSNRTESIINGGTDNCFVSVS